MTNGGGWLRRLGNKIKTGLMRFMFGRYGTDKLNSLFLWTGLIFCLLSMFMPYAFLRPDVLGHFPDHVPQYL